MFTDRTEDGFFLLVRSIEENNYTKFVKEDADFSKLAIRYFSAKESECSVYQVFEPSDESKIISAHWTISKKNHIPKLIAARVSKELIVSIGMSIRQSMGTTGIKFVDDRHHDILGPEDDFVKLLDGIRSLALEGRDVFRVCEAPVIANQVKSFLAFGNEDITETALENCKRVLSTNFKHLLEE